MNTVNAELLPIPGTKNPEAKWHEPLPGVTVESESEKRRALAKILDEYRRAHVREVDSYPQQLDDLHQLLEAATVVGNLVYTPGPGRVLPAGTHTLWVAFTPADSAADARVQAAVSVVVAKATPAVFWPDPAEISYGTALDDFQLNASASVSGIFEYSPAHGEVLTAGTHRLSVTFTPTDSANYATAQAAVSLNVIKSMPVIHWPTPDPITYGTLLGPEQLCANASVPGRFEYNPHSGVMLAAGEHKLSVTFIPDNASDNHPSHAVVSLTVAKAKPVVTWPQPEPIAHGTALSATQLNSSATVPGSFAYTPAACEIFAPGVHKLLVTFIPTDTLNYSTVHADVLLNVTEKLPSVINWPVPAAISYGTALSEAQLNATASVPGAFVFTPAAGLVLAPGRYTLVASFTPSECEKYSAAQTSVILEVERMPDPASLPTIHTPPPAPRTFTSNGHVTANPKPAEVTSVRTSVEPNPRETRTYKGAIYEKGTDGQWHLQKK